jgi:hypothetical protein
MEEIKVDNRVGYVSLVGILGDDFPLSHGNYFSLGGYHVLNMWHENFEHLNITKDKIDAVKFGDNHIVIIDDDIPEDYLNDKPCFTGGRGVNKELYKEVYDYMFPKFDKLKCLCCESANNVSVFFNVRTVGKGTGGIALSKGNCRICGREVFANNNEEVSEEVYNKLREIKDSIPYDGVYLSPYTITTVMDKGHVYAPDIPDGIKSRYSKKKIDSSLYGTTKVGKESDEPKKEEVEKKVETKVETRYTKKHKVGMIKKSDLKED